VLLAALAMNLLPRFLSFASTPPMGWNSWDCFATTVTEEQTLAQADVMARVLKPFGWKIITVDIQWYEPNAQSFDYRQNAKLIHDEYGRLQPAPNRFPRGFKALGAELHKKGLKFGIHLLRGIPRQCVADNTRVLGTSYHAKDIANTKSVCAWNPDMYGVDMSKPAAQDYYNSVFQQFAEWGVDLVKVDDISRPYHDNLAEIEGIRKAIDHTGRPIILSLSPGETPIDAADHVSNHANMWRISDDFWDEWRLLEEQFERLNKWSRVVGPGHWPDADMLPLGKIRFGQPTRFTRDEQVTMMSLWAIARSPLILGCDLTKLDDWTTSLLTNKELIRVNQRGSNPRQLRRVGDEVVWVSNGSRKGEMFVGLFNLGGKEREIGLEPNDLKCAGFGRIKDLWSGSDLKNTRLQVPAHGARLLSVTTRK